MGLIWVEGALPNGVVCLFDRDAKHPDGEVWITSGVVCQAAETERVLMAIAEGRLLRVDDPAPAAAPIPAAAAADEDAFSEPEGEPEPPKRSRRRATE